MTDHADRISSMPPRSRSPGVKPAENLVRVLRPRPPAIPPPTSKRPAKQKVVPGLKGSALPLKKTKARTYKSAATVEDSTPSPPESEEDQSRQVRSKCNVSHF